MAPLEMNEGTPSGVGYNKLNSFSVEDPAKRPLLPQKAEVLQAFVQCFATVCKHKQGRKY
jgi:hypothetical protein